MSDPTDNGLGAMFKNSNVHGVSASYIERIEQELDPAERPLCVCRVQSVTLDGQRLRGASPLLLVTNQRLFAIEFYGGGWKANMEVHSISAADIEQVSAMDGMKFDITLRDRQPVHVVMIGLLSKKYSIALYDALLNMADKESVDE